VPSTPRARPYRALRAFAAVLVLTGCSERLPGSWLFVTGVTAHEAVVTGTGGPPSAVTCTTGDGRVVTGVVSGDEPWRARVSGLTENAAYTCTVARAHGTRTIRFRTAAPPDDSVIFAVVGDTGDESPEATVLAYRLAANPPDFVLHVGDLAYPTATPYALNERFFRAYRRLLATTAFFATPGNHDLGPGAAYHPFFEQTTLPRSPGGDQYAFDWGPMHLLALSSRTLGLDADEERAWIAADLARARERPWRIAFIHDPVFSPGEKNTVRGLRRMLVPVLEAGGVQLLITGHVHLYARAEASCVADPTARMVQVVTGGGSADLDPAVPHPAFPRIVSRTQYLRVRVTPRTIDGKAIDLDGRVLDRFRLHHGDTGPCRSDGWPTSRVPP
jgi:hypothetical protein